MVVTLNLGEQAGETAGFDAADHLAVLAEHAPDLRVDTVLADARQRRDEARRPRRQLARDARRRAASSPTSRVGDGTPRHDPVQLAAAYSRIMGAAT